MGRPLGAGHGYLLLLLFFVLASCPSPPELRHALLCGCHVPAVPGSPHSIPWSPRLCHWHCFAASLSATAIQCEEQAAACHANVSAATPSADQQPPTCFLAELFRGIPLDPRLPRELMGSLSLEVLNNHSDVALRDTASGHGGGGLGDLSVLFQPECF